MTRKLMQNFLVVLPGITGSVLETRRTGEKLWAPAPQAILPYLRSLGRSLDRLRIETDDPECQYPGDIVATRLIDYSLVPGLKRFDGYTGLRRLLNQAFDLTPGDPLDQDGPPANYFEFAYDWRRDNRHTACALKKFIQRELPKWRTKNPHAKVIFICHSMGGLVARYYCEILHGYKDTKALISFGTPYRGSLNCLEYLANGYRKLFLNFTHLMRSFTSVYQLLPIYEAVETSPHVWRRAAEVDIEHVDKERAERALQFHREIERAQEANRGESDYELQVLPIQGWGHRTLQSARWENRKVSVGIDLPPAVDDVFDGGDGTVPRVSAIPIEMEAEQARWWPVNQKHATMQNGSDLLWNLVQTLMYFQGTGRPPARGVGTGMPLAGVDLEVEDVYVKEEPVTIRVRSSQEIDIDPKEVSIRLEALSGTTEPKQVGFVSEADGLSATVERLAAGPYRATLHFQGGPRDRITDVFEVWDE